MDEVIVRVTYDPELDRLVAEDDEIPAGVTIELVHGADPAKSDTVKGKGPRVQPTAEQTIKDVFSNISGPAYAFQDMLIEHWEGERRPLQQGFVRHVIKPVLQTLVADHSDGLFDAANEASCRFAKRALEATRDIDLPLIDPTLRSVSDFQPDLVEVLEPPDDPDSATIF